MSRIREKEKELAGGETNASGDYPWMERPPDTVDQSTTFLPCHYFDYVGGTSTGG
jgi:hypothetical protein